MGHSLTLDEPWTWQHGPSHWGHHDIVELTFLWGQKLDCYESLRKKYETPPRIHVLVGNLNTYLGPMVWDCDGILWLLGEVKSTRGHLLARASYSLDAPADVQMNYHFFV